MTLAALREEIARRPMPDEHKARIFLAIARATQDLPPRNPITNIGDVERLAVDDPDKYDRLLRSYWQLMGGSAAGALDALHRAEHGERPGLKELNDPEVVAAYPRARAAVRRANTTRDRRRNRVTLVATGLLAIAIARGQAAA